MKAQKAQTAYHYSIEIGEFVVTLEHLTNDRNGNARYKAVIVNLDNAKKADSATTAYTYSGQGSLAGEQATASAFLEHHIKTVYGFEY